MDNNTTYLNEILSFMVYYRGWTNEKAEEYFNEIYEDLKDEPDYVYEFETEFDDDEDEENEDEFEYDFAEDGEFVKVIVSENKSNILSTISDLLSSNAKTSSALNKIIDEIKR